MNEKWMGLFAMEGLKNLADAKKHVEKINKFLRHEDGDYRRAAKKLLKKLGIDIEPASPAAHLISSRGKVPKGLEEWSSNLDMDDLRPTLEKLSRCIDKGFEAKEIDEVCGVAEEMRHDQTKALKFSVSAAGRNSDLFIIIFMDDIDAPDLAIHARAEVIKKMGLLR